MIVCRRHDSKGSKHLYLILNYIIYVLARASIYPQRAARSCLVGGTPLYREWPQQAVKVLSGCGCGGAFVMPPTLVECTCFILRMCLSPLAEDKVKDIDYNDPKRVYNDLKQEFEPDTAANRLDKLNKFLNALQSNVRSPLCTMADVCVACFVSGASSGLPPIRSSNSRSYGRM